tara:strand:- start:38736 stop:38891 length:156 start_codon:yes stop_codon:yes gene_type:complete
MRRAQRGSIILSRPGRLDFFGGSPLQLLSSSKEETGPPGGQASGLAAICKH